MAIVLLILASKLQIVIIFVDALELLSPLLCDPRSSGMLLWLPASWDNLSVTSSGVLGRIGYPETSVNNYRCVTSQKKELLLDTASGLHVGDCPVCCYLSNIGIG